MNLSMNHPLRRSLVKQLIFIDENRIELVNLYLAATRGKEKDYDFFGRYITKIESFLRDFDNRFSPKMDTVYIGCEVSILYNEENEEEKFTICFPDHSNPDDGHVSFLSPVGRQLLLRGVGETLTLTTPLAEVAVTIKDIEFKQYC
ncbi:GreA/GreB family elongation factor [Ammoniphilus sp. CFH 90114]|uniref:GreA/GreB family elongation factor n=1 Tax=Ammoniphilus sp. CFH 90114 TaxID=2493665 RepID=UPI0013E96DB2|nr:GreA/GreB family elongation factor [Ammoniphilus sp. CFH 90114]